MDRILDAVMVSPHSEAVKHGMVQRVIESAPQPLDSAQCWAMYEVSTKLFLLGDSEFERDVGREVLEAFAQHHSQEFEQFFNMKFVLNLLHVGYGPLGKRSHQIFHYIQTGLRFVADSPSSLDLFHLLQIEVLRIVCERPGPKLCARVSKLLCLYPQCVPSGNLQTVFCQQLILSISHFQCKSDGDDEILKFLENVTKASGMLQGVWRNNVAVILPSLKELFIVISSPGEGDSVPSNALASVVQYVPLELMDAVVRNLTNDKNISDAQMLTAISRMVDWLSWPLTRNIDKWIIALMKGVATVNKFRILIEVTLMKIEQVFSKLFYPVVREGAVSVLSYMLLSFQQSPEAFHLLLPQIPQLISSLTREESDSGRGCLVQLSQLIHCLIFRFSGFPDIYEPVLGALKDLPVPSENRIKQLLGQNAWATQKSDLASYCHRLPAKSDTGKTGLVNLGNTCYMNSVIQALFMASDFRHGVLHLTQCDALSLMMKLQSLFAFLERSQRPTISPVSFLTASCPPWFNLGDQQDCSEYLKYLLDRLHEEEKTNSNTIQNLSCLSIAGDIENSEGTGRTLIQKMFGGRMVTRIRCLCCENISWREEVFTDLSLALPPPRTSLSGSFIIDPAQPVVEEIGPSSQRPTSKPQRQAPQSPSKDKKPLKQEESSVRVVPVETIGSIEQVMPYYSDEYPKSNSMSAVASEEQTHGTEACRSITDLINYFLSPEMLTGENKYHCQKCSALRDAEKVVEVTEGPHYLILTLLRFSFDLGTMRRRKISDNVSIPLVLKLPVRVSSREQGCISAGNLEPKPGGSAYESLTYDLCSVVVHSGVSSESGHYYCYAREYVGSVFEKHSRGSTGAPADQTTSESQWFLFNDNRVSYSSFESVSNVTIYFPKDTAYVMFYRKRPSHQTESESECISAAENLYGEEPLPKQLSEEISKDNMMYLQEQERAARYNAASSSAMAGSPVWLRRQRGDGEAEGGGTLWFY
ncbi:ubiquitin carboxyl-terminal hydrolase 35-like isoform X1 [Acipenser ruthenus]|uniref:ubiquitin carboxyl-terminal hydrolase 35-like isoform X1 n=1 Tax=Acipenser ruthenus TaxID=7906 RepID=UPI002740754B|nr:ubiquitin carboxyl-terminal hydrolase 35-like isoform X1 [Acipenser ruthenus]